MKRPEILLVDVPPVEGGADAPFEKVQVSFVPPVAGWTFPTAPADGLEAARAALWTDLMKAAVKHALENGEPASPDAARQSAVAYVHDVLRVWWRQGRVDFGEGYGYPED